MNIWLSAGIGFIIGIGFALLGWYLLTKYHRPRQQAVDVKLNENTHPCYVVSVLAVRRPSHPGLNEGKNVTFGSRLVNTDNVEKASEIAIQDFMKSNFLDVEDHEILTAVAPVAWRVEFTQQDSTVSVNLNLHTLNDRHEYAAVAQLIQSHRQNFKKIVDGLDYTRSPSFTSANDRTGQDYLNN